MEHETWKRKREGEEGRGRGKGRGKGKREGEEGRGSEGVWLLCERGNVSLSRVLDVKHVTRGILRTAMAATYQVAIIQ